MNRIVALKTEMNFGDVKDAIYPVVLCDSSHRVLVDCGYIGSLPKIEEALRKNDIAPECITHMILTHQDHDHVGAAAAFKKKYPDVTVMASAIEAAYISGAEKSLRLEQAEQFQKSLPPEQQAFGEAFCSLLRRVEPVKIDYLLNAGDVLPFCGGCHVLATPGHTPGHISLYIPELETVIPGDAMALENGKPVIANPQFALDIEKAAASFEMLMSLLPKKIICYHGGQLNIN